VSETTSFVVLSSAAAGRDAELRAWYEGVHLPDARAIPGVVSARVYEQRPVDGRPPADRTFMAVYELDGDPAVVWAEFDRRIAEGVMAMTDALDPASLSFSVWAPCASGA
jgi:hypothetical protein